MIKGPELNDDDFDAIFSELAEDGGDPEDVVQKRIMQRMYELDEEFDLEE